MELKSPKGTTTEMISVPFCLLWFLLYKPLLQNSPSISISKIIVFFVSGLYGVSRMVLIFTSMPHSIVQRKYAGNKTKKAKGTEKILEIFKIPGNSSAFLSVIELDVEQKLTLNLQDILVPKILFGLLIVLLSKEI